MRILRLPAVSELTGLPRSTLYLYMSKGLFPKPIKLGARSVGWVQDEVNQWLRQKVESRIS
nr:AlpA family transcriptional regulator [Diaphorobacter nitroreducens]